MNSQQVGTPDGIDWHIEFVQNAAADVADHVNKEHIILIPSGEGDCHNLGALAQSLVSLAQQATVVTTFDMPGFSRSIAPKEAYAVITPELVAKQVMGLLDELEISRATFFGCSSGGGAVLAITALYPDRVKCGIVHEVPFTGSDSFNSLRQRTDEEITKFCHEFFYQWIEEENDGKAKYKALGEDYLRRLDKNFVTWIRCLVTNWEEQSRALATTENLLKRPLFWTIGGLSPLAFWEINLEIAGAAGLKVERAVLVSSHFPAVTVPDDTAKWIQSCVQKVDSFSKND